MEKIQKTASELRGLLAETTTEARDIVSSIFDEGTFVELGSYVKRANATDESDFESVVCGCGAIDGRLVYTFVQDSSNMKGALSEAHSNKICSVYDMAAKSGAPVIGVFSSSGAKVMEGISVISGYGKIMKKAAQLKGMVPQIAIVAGVCAASTAIIASMFDFVICAQDKAQFFVTPPFINGMAAQETVNLAAKRGDVDILAADCSSAIAEAKKLLAYLPSSDAESAPYEDGDDINRTTPEIADVVAKDGYSMLEVIKSVADFGVFEEISKDCAPEIKVGFIRINGAAVAVCANDPSVRGGAITPCAAHKAAKFVDFCNCFDIPLVTLVDSVGFEASADYEKNHYSEKLAELAAAYASSENAMVTCVLGNAFGASFTLMGSKSLGADIAFASENAKISVMSPEAAVQFIWSDEIKSASDSAAKREELISEWNNTLASPIAAAKCGDIDDIISLDELRQRIAAALEILAFKGRAI